MHASRTVLAAVIAVALVIIAVAIFPPYYQSNDDVGMRIAAEQGVPFLLFIHAGIGKLLTLLYSVAPALPWYDLVLGTSQTIAVAALLYVWSEDDRLWMAILAIFLLLPAFVSVQFSVVAMTCAAAGLVLILDGRPLPGSLLFVWGSMIRLEGAVLIAVEAAVLAAPLLIGSKQRLPWRPLLLSAAAAAALFGLNLFAYQRAPGWEEFYEYNAHRASLSETLTREQLTPAALQRLRRETGWSSNDFVLFRDWFFTDQKLYSFDKVRRAHAIFAPRRESHRRRAALIATEFLFENRWALLLLAAFTLARGARMPLVLYYLFVVLVLVLFVAGITFTAKPPPSRVTWPMLILGATMLSMAARRWGSPPRRWRTAIALLFALFVAGPSLPSLYRRADTSRRASEIVQRDAMALTRTGAELYFFHASAFPYERYWQPLRAAKLPVPFIGLGTSIRTPPIQEALRAHGITDVPLALCTDPRLMLLTFQHAPPHLRRFVAEHHGIDVRWERVMRTRSFSVWRCWKP